MTHVLLALTLLAASAPEQERFPFPLLGVCPPGSSALRYWQRTFDDDPRFADPSFDDSTWSRVESTGIQTHPESWNGRAWFRRRIELPDALHGVPVGLFGAHRGAMEIYVDGALIGRHGDPDRNTLRETPGSLATMLGAFSGRAEHVIAIRYGVLPNATDPSDSFAFALDVCDVVAGTTGIRARREPLIVSSALFVGFAAGLGLLHLFLFLFLRKDPGHLEYSAFTLSIATLSGTVLFRAFDLTMLSYRLSVVTFTIAIILLTASGVRFFSRLAFRTEHLGGRVITWTAVPLLLASPWLPIPASYAYCIVGFVFMLYFMVGAVRDRPRDLAIVVFGLVAALVASFVQMAAELFHAEYDTETAYIYGFVVLLLSMSVYLARDVAVLRELRDTRAQLVQSEKMAALGQLVAGIAHEINTPIGAISSVHDSIARAVAKLREQLAPEILEEKKVAASMKVLEDGTAVIKTGSNRVSGIVQRLKAFARLDEADLQDADLHEGIEDTLVLLDHELKENITVHRDYGELPLVRCHPGQLNQVFMNLLMNARQAIDGKGDITIRTRVVGDDVTVAISDTGVGIPSENLKRIFDPGFTTKGVRVGTGLGLAICYRIIEAHKGRIEVESKVGKGTTFMVRVPVAGSLKRST